MYLIGSGAFLLGWLAHWLVTDVRRRRLSKLRWALYTRRMRTYLGVLALVLASTSAFAVPCGDQTHPPWQFLAGAVCVAEPGNCLGTCENDVTVIRRCNGVQQDKKLFTRYINLAGNVVRPGVFPYYCNPPLGQPNPTGLCVTWNETDQCYARQTLNQKCFNKSWQYTCQ